MGLGWVSLAIRLSPKVLALAALSTGGKDGASDSIEKRVLIVLGWEGRRDGLIWFGLDCKGWKDGWMYG